MYDGDIRKDEEMKKILVEKAIEKLPNSYAPYSHYNVAAAALFDSGEIYTGVNVESASLGMTICAERNAIFHAIAEGEKKLLAVAIVGGTDGERREYCVPCGACRQVMREFCDEDKFKILVVKNEKEYEEYLLKDLLPKSFGPDNLAK